MDEGRIEYELAENQVFRANALGRFLDLLAISAHSPAMLIYLDNVSSRKQGPGENYARELLEPHSMGVDNGYTAQALAEMARPGGSRHYPENLPRTAVGPHGLFGSTHFQPLHCRQHNAAAIQCLETAVSHIAPSGAIIHALPGIGIDHPHADNPILITPFKKNENTAARQHDPQQTVGQIAWHTRVNGFGFSKTWRSASRRDVLTRRATVARYQIDQGDDGGGEKNLGNHPRIPS